VSPLPSSGRSYRSATPGNHHGNAYATSSDSAGPTLRSQIAELLALRETIAQLGAAASATEPDTGPPNRSCRCL
ncbi:MAG TPA: hypothetical protein VIM49_13305, partial [Dermatophilaceae bacterium]